MKAMTALASSAEQVLRPGFSRVATPPSDAPVETKPPEPDSGELEPSVWSFIRKYSLRQQILLLLLTLVSFPFLYYSLKLPKEIVNHAIGGKHFPQTVFGIDFDQVPYLMFLCGIF